jgi:hypothetical protein
VLGAFQRVDSSRDAATLDIESYDCLSLNNRLRETLSEQGLTEQMIINMERKFSVITASSKQKCLAAKLVVDEWIHLQYLKEIQIAILKGPVTVIWESIKEPFFNLIAVVSTLASMYGLYIAPFSSLLGNLRPNHSLQYSV